MLNLTFLVLILSTLATQAVAMSCEEYFKSLDNGVLSDFVGLRVKDSTGKYAFGLCTDADSKQSPGAGVIQLGQSSGPIAIGRWGQFYANSGRGWVELVYNGGSGSPEDMADKHCIASTTGWSAHTMLVCDSTDRSGSFRYVGRVAGLGNGTGCYSLFELLHRRLCSLDSSQGGLPASAIVLIVLLSLFCAYLLLGAAVQRFVYNRRGLEAMPNYTMWRKLGDAMADGCDFVCRSGGRGGGSGGDTNGRYQQVGGQTEEDDEHLIAG